MFATRHIHRKFTPFLPDDVLRQVFEIAAKLDTRTAFNLSLLSRNIHPWIDEIMYSEVILRSHRTASAFLRTIQTPDTKPPDFFANCVKTMLIYSDIEIDILVTLLSICRGVVNLSYWPSSLGYATNNAVQAGHAKNGSGKHRLNSPSPWNSHTGADVPNSSPTPHRRPAPIPLSLHQATRLHIRAVTQAFDLHNVSHIAPRTLSVQLHEDHSLFAFRPHFLGVPFFSALTHISIVNRWEEWTAWAGSRMSIEALPQLTHLKFDFIVGQAPTDSTPAKRRSVSPSCSRWLETVTNSTCPSPTDSDRTAISAAESSWTRKMTQVASALADVLNGHASLKVCVLVLRFDANPARTAKLISMHAAPKMLHWQSHNAAQSCSRDGVQSVVNMEDEGNKMEVDFDLTPPSSSVAADAPPPKFDPRLVFAWEKEAFRYNYAHSLHENMIWKSSEAVANAQRYLSGYTMLNCDYLI